MYTSVHHREAENTELTTPAEKSEDKKEEKLTAKEKKKREKEEQVKVAYVLANLSAVINHFGLS